MRLRWLLPLLLLAPLGTLAQPACTVAALLGSAQRLAADGSTQTLGLGSPLAVGDQVQTAADARLRLRCSDGSSLVLAGGSQLRIEVFEQAGGRRGEARFQLLQGLIGQTVAPGGGWKVRTPSAVTAVRGTEFLVDVQADGSTQVLTRSGLVDVQAVKPGTRSIGALIAMVPPAMAVGALLGSECRDGRCSPAAPWSAQRQQALLDRLRLDAPAD